MIDFTVTDGTKYETDDYTLSSAEMLSLVEPHFERKQYSVVRWNTLSDGTGKTYQQEETFNLSADDVDLYAVWEKTICTVEFEMSGHGTQIQPAEVKTGNVVPRPPDPTEEGWTFLNWWGDDGSRKKVWDFSANRITADIILSAEWYHDLYDVSCDSSVPLKGYAQGGGTFYYGDTTTISAFPSATCRFDYWDDGNVDAVRTVVVYGPRVYTAYFSTIDNLLYFESQEEGATIAFEKVGSPWEANFLSSSDGENWNEYAVGTTYSFPSIGSRFYLKRADGVNTGLLSKSASNYYKFVMSKLIAAYGNIQWLLDRTGQSLSCSDYCYYGMFYYCASLTQAPALPATALANSCYQHMFFYCASLAQAPALPATALANCCYVSMFTGCSSLAQAPALPASALTIYCYTGMFYGCTSLTQAPALSATELAPYCYQYMFFNCTSLSVNENVEEGSLVLSVASGTGEPIGWSGDMFSHTAGRFKGTPTVGNVYRCYGQ